MNREDIDLVCVLWGDDTGVVSLKTNKVLMYVAAPSYIINTFYIPVLIVKDKDFPYFLSNNFPNWDDVTKVINHPEFPLFNRLKDGFTKVSDRDCFIGGFNQG